jgi:hypothetical protein
MRRTMEMILDGSSALCFALSRDGRKHVKFASHLSNP